MPIIMTLGIDIVHGEHCHEHEHCHDDECHSHTHCHHPEDSHGHEHVNEDAPGEPVGCAGVCDDAGMEE